MIYEANAYVKSYESPPLPSETLPKKPGTWTALSRNLDDGQPLVFLTLALSVGACTSSSLRTSAAGTGLLTKKHAPACLKLSLVLCLHSQATLCYPTLFSNHRGRRSSNFSIRTKTEKQVEQVLSSPVGLESNAWRLRCLTWRRQNA